MFELAKLPYEKNALEPYISEETLEFHYGKHHQTYVNNLNNLVADSDMADCTLEEVIEKSQGPVFNNAAQVWNHTFYWESLRAGIDGNTPSGLLTGMLEENFWSFDEFKEKFSASAIGNFASGWTWLAQNADGSLQIVNTDDAETLAVSDQKPLLVIDVWEHAYYIDYRNARPEYVDNFWKLVNWDMVEKRMS